jgi:putative acetyltransferase
LRETGLAGVTIEIRKITGPMDEARTLVAELEQELSRHYAPEQRHGLAFDSIFQPNIRFFVAWRQGAAVGCGAIALCRGFAEVKRMYVRPAARGQGVADALLARLAEEARIAGLTALRLETGIHQKVAIRFYERYGFGPCEAFEPYSAMSPHSISTSVFMEMGLG